MIKGNINIAVLCNNKMAMPAIQKIAEAGMLCGIATSDNDPEVVHLFSDMATAYSLPYHKISHKVDKKQMLQWLQDTQPGAVFVMTFPWLIPLDILSVPAMGFINFHYGLLPEMRGADPIFESIRQRRQNAGLSIHIMDEGFDTGPLLMKEQFPLSPEFTYGMLCRELAYIGEKMCTQLLAFIKEGKLPAALPQDMEQAAYWPRVPKEEIMIRWHEMDSAAINALVKSCNPIAKGAVAILNGWQIGVCDVTEVNLQGDASAIEPGTIIAADPQNGLLVFCKDGKALKLDVVYTQEGILPGYKLAMWGISAGMKFSTEGVKTLEKQLN